MNALLSELRQRFHADLVSSGVLSVDADGRPSNADKSQASSVALARGILNKIKLNMPASQPLKGQTAGKEFESQVANFLRKALEPFESLRPGHWEVENVGSRRGIYHLSNYYPYTHLYELAMAVKRDPALAAILGNSYEISPDVLVLRQPVKDDEINANTMLVDEHSGTRSPLRLRRESRPIVHAVVSCKWTLRSDRAQNARSEALSLIRNRKGRAPHIVVVTAEPSPSRLASLALGTGDIDTVYHVALPELLETATEHDKPEILNLISTLTDGDRLRDVADLPLDLLL